MIIRTAGRSGSCGMWRVDNDWYDDLGDAWWDPRGPVRALHEINPLRVQYFLRAMTPLEGRRVLDLGCGGGLMAEACARAGALTVGLDASGPSLAAAQRHAARAGTPPIRYVQGRAEALPFPDAQFDAVGAADSLEHVDDLARTLDECARVLRPGGLLVFNTINRTWMARVIMIWGAQSLLRFAPPATHHYERFIRPEDLQRELRARGLAWVEARGLQLRRRPAAAAWSCARGGSLGGFRFSSDTRVSYGAPHANSRRGTVPRDGNGGAASGVPDVRVCGDFGVERGQVDWAQRVDIGHAHGAAEHLYLRAHSHQRVDSALGGGINVEAAFQVLALRGDAHGAVAGVAGGVLLTADGDHGRGGRGHSGGAHSDGLGDIGSGTEAAGGDDVDVAAPRCCKWRRARKSAYWMGIVRFSLARWERRRCRRRGRRW